MTEDRNEDRKAKRESQPSGMTDETRELLRQAASQRTRDGHGRFSAEIPPRESAPQSPKPSAVPPPPPSAPQQPPSNSREEPKCAVCQLCPVAQQMYDALAKYPDGNAPEDEIAPMREVCRNCSKPMCQSDKPAPCAHAASRQTETPPATPPAQSPSLVGRLGGLVQHINSLVPHPLLKLLPFPFPSLDHCDESTKTYIAFLLERLASETNAAEKYRTRCRHLVYVLAGIGVVALNWLCVWFALRFFGGGGEAA